MYIGNYFVGAAGADVLGVLVANSCTLLQSIIHFVVLHVQLGGFYSFLPFIKMLKGLLCFSVKPGKKVFIEGFGTFVQYLADGLNCRLPRRIGVDKIQDSRIPVLLRDVIAYF